MWLQQSHRTLCETHLRTLWKPGKEKVVITQLKKKHFPIPTGRSSMFALLCPTSFLENNLTSHFVMFMSAESPKCSMHRVDFYSLKMKSTKKESVAGEITQKQNSGDKT